MDALRHFIYCTLCILFLVILGGGVFEHLCIWPYALSALPASLSMFQGDSGLNTQAFWPRIHPVTLLFFVTSLILFWRSERRKYLLASFVLYVLVLIWTFVFFVPELLDLLGTEYSSVVNEDLVARAARWETLSRFRLFMVLVIGYLLLTGLTKPARRPQSVVSA